ncbi:hypothetical protein BD410DRAFT_767173 [Rickenella mellea]|uniref:F-box domain-containing protein n=1 Tax=Rickenella mellea TaxID=50990 RepID=A0A4Y7QAC7_9AGAM|nr:hypothetical protein BD410DRAFT_767173 [Rickenella mellea]
MRRQNPKRNVRKRNYKEDDEDEDGDDFKTRKESVVSASPGATEKRPVKRRGRLSLLPTLAMDVLFEVFVCLQPLDVLNIMYTSKGFRDLLIAPSSTFIWKAVLMNVDGLPDCPPFLSEVEYAKLAFNPYCYRCGKRTPNGPQWEVLARFCGTCLDNVLTPAFDLPSRVNDSYKSVLGLIKNEQRRSRKSGYGPYFYCEPQVRRLLMHVESLPEKSSESWIADAQRNASGIRKHAKLCRDWEDRVRTCRQEQLEETKLKRREDINRKLTQLGFGTALSYVELEFENHHLVKPGVALTERIWNNIKPELVGWMQEHETKRLARSALNAYTIAHPDLILPRTTDFLASAGIKRVVRSLGDVPVSEETFGDSEMTAFMDNWRRTSALRLADLLATPTDEPALAKLELATTVFSCKCRRSFLKDPFPTASIAHEIYMHYPWVMAHPCVTGECSQSKYRVWNIKDLQHDGEAGDTLIKPIIEACSLPPETTRTSDMDTLDPRLICLHCKQAKRSWYVTVYTWRSAIVHALTCPHKETGYLWHQLSDEVAERAKKTESNTYGRKLVDDAAREADTQDWGCTPCRGGKYPTEGRIEWVTSHFSYAHKGSEPAYYRCARSPPGMFEVNLPANECDK